MLAPTPPQPVSRRSLVQGAAAVGAVVGAGLAAPALAGGPTATAISATAVGSSDLVPADALQHLLRRATYGITPASLAEIRSLGATKWLEQQLNPGSIVDTECDALLARMPLAKLSIAGVHSAVQAGKLKMYTWDIMREVQLAHLGRAIWSRRQLFEVMVDFWSNHLNVTCPSGDVWDNRQDYDRNVIRRFALGRFADMLKASAKHPAMLAYLDNRSSSKTKPNENYGRELLELHTVGLVHSEADVQNAARLLTGMTIDWDTGLYRYDRYRHATGAVRVLTFSHANTTDYGGEAASMAMLDYLAHHPATAQRIAYKLCVRFVSDEPPAGLVNRLAQIYLVNRTAIAPVLRALFTSAEFAAARGAKVRTPLEDLAATVRILGYKPELIDPDTNPTGVTALTALLWCVYDAGQGPLAWAPPNGYPDVAAAWASPSGHLQRWNNHLNIAAGWWPKQLVRPASQVDDLVGTLPATYGQLVDKLATRLFGRTMRPAHTAAVTAMFGGRQPSDPLRARDDVIKWSFPYLVSILLDSPYFTAR